MTKKPKLKINLMQGRTGRNDPIRRSKMAEPDPPRKPSLPVKRRNIIIPLLIVGGLTLTAFGLLHSGEPQVINVTVAPVLKENLIKTVSGTGTTKAELSRNVAFPSAGIVRKVNIKVGDSVQQGQILAELDTTTINRDLLAAQASLQSSDADLTRAEANARESQAERGKQLQAAELAFAAAQTALSDSERSLKLQQELLQTGAASQQDVRNAQNSRDEAQRKLQSVRSDLKFAKSRGNESGTAAIQQARAARRSAQVRVENLEKNLKDAVLRSPVTGIVSAMAMSEGNPAPTSNAIEITDPARLYLEVPFDETRAVQLKAGQPAQIEFDALAKPMTGKVQRVSPVAHQSGQTASVPVRIKLNDPSAVKPGFTGTATVTTKRLTDVMTVPLEATSEQGGKYVVWRVGKINKNLQSGVALPIEIEISERNASRAAVVGKLMPDDLIITPAPTRIEKENPVQYITQQTQASSGNSIPTSQTAGGQP